MISPLEKTIKKRKKRAKNGTITKAKVWSAFSRYIRLLNASKDGNCVCATCGKVQHWSLMHAGHSIGGRGNDVIFDEFVVWPQCELDNIWKNGCYPQFAVFMIKKFGLEWFEARIERSKRTHKLGKADLMEIYEHYSGEVERLKQEKGL